MTLLNYYQLRLSADASDRAVIHATERALPRGLPRAERHAVYRKAMPQRRLKMTAAKAEKLFTIDIVDAPPPLRVEAVARPPLAAIAPDPPGDPIPPPAPAPAPPSPPTPGDPIPPPAPPSPPPAPTASVREAAPARKASAKPRAAGSRRPPAPVPPPVATPPNETRH